MKSCYLTIDDSPSIHTGDMVNFLAKRDIPALLFVRGDLVAQNPAPIVNAIQHGFYIGNHSYGHRPYGEMSYDECIADIKSCEDEIEKCYKVAGVSRPGKYFRFPYLDRGNGDRVERHFDSVANVDINDDEKITALQNYLKNMGFHQPFKKCAHPLYDNPSIKAAADCLMTFTSYDWMLTTRHIGKWPFHSIDDLKKRIDQDHNLQNSEGNILIFHDQSETFETFQSLIDHMIERDYTFLSFP